MSATADPLLDPLRRALDVAVPMTYFRVTTPECTYLPLRPGAEPNPDWRCMIRDHVGGLHAAGRHLYAGIQASWPRDEVERQIRIGRDRSFQSLNTRGLYPAGEGAGYAGGILSAGVDGIRVAEAVAMSLTGQEVPAEWSRRRSEAALVYG